MDSISEIWLLVMSAFFEVLVTYQLFNHFCEKKEKTRWNALIVSGVTIVIITAVSLFKNIYLNIIAMLIIKMCYAKILFKCKNSYALFGAAVFVMIGMVAEIGTSFGVSFAFNVDTSNTVNMTDYKVIVYFISNSLLIIITRIIIASIPSVKQQEIDRIQLCLIVFPIFAILNEFFLLHLAIRFELERRLFFFCMLIGIGLIYGGLLLIMVYERGIQKRVLENELCLARQKEEANETFYRLQERNLHEVRAVMHDFKKQLIHLQDMYEGHDTDVEKYQQELMQTLESQIKRQAIDVNNKVLSSILQSTQIYCEQLQISFSFKSDIYDLGFLTPLDTSAIFDNAIDNAIEACKKMSDTAEKKFNITIHEAKHFVLIEFKNTYEQEPQEVEGRLLTAKDEKSKHGYGVQNIFTVAQRYGGDGMYQYKNGIFTLMVRLQVPNK